MQVVSTLQHLLRLEPGCRLVDFGAGACKLASQLHRSETQFFMRYMGYMGYGEDIASLTLVQAHANLPHNSTGLKLNSI